MKHPNIQKTCITAVAVILAVVAPAAWANADLAKAKNCMACHTVATKVVGPAFKDIAAKYAGQKDVGAKLATKVVKGSSGAWGPIPMPPNPQVSADEAAALVKWILAQK